MGANGVGGLAEQYCGFVFAAEVADSDCEEFPTLEGVLIIEVDVWPMAGRLGKGVSVEVEQVAPFCHPCRVASGVVAVGGVGDPKVSLGVVGERGMEVLEAVVDCDDGGA